MDIPDKAVGLMKFLFWIARLRERSAIQSEAIDLYLCIPATVNC